MSAAGQRKFGKYEVQCRLAVGGMGEIFLARQTGLAGFERPAIIKTLLPDVMARDGSMGEFLDEARVVATLSHPNIVGILDVGQAEDGTLFIAMEYIRGVDLETLGRLARARGVQIPPRVAAAILRGAAVGLDHAHNAVDSTGKALKLVHRDVSPHNVMVRMDGVVKLVDFGIAKSSIKATRTEGNLVKGKLRYMSPEQVRGQALDGRSDQFSLGIVAWEMLARRDLFSGGENVIEAARQIVSAPIQPISTIVDAFPVDLEAVVMRMLKRRPEDRYPRLADAAADLQKFLDATGGSATTEVQSFLEVVALDVVREKDTHLQAPSSTAGLGPACARCGTRSEAGARFCPECGMRMAGNPTPHSMQRVARSPFSLEPAPEPPAVVPPPAPVAPAPLPRPQLPVEEALELAFERGRQGDVLRGRNDELHVIRQAFRRADRREIACLTFTGEPGVGKSRLLVEAERLAKTAGYLPVRVRGARYGVPVMMDLWRQIVLALGGALAPNALSAEDLATRSASDVMGFFASLQVPAPILQRVQQLFDGTVVDEILDVKEHHARLQMALLQLLLWVSQRRKVCLLVDDLHRADPMSLEALADLGRTLGQSTLAVLATASTDARPVPGFERMALRPLQNEDLLALVEGALRGGPVPPQAAQAISAASSGKPLLALHHVRLLQDFGVLRQVNGRWMVRGTLESVPLPTSVDDVTRRLMAQLPARLQHQLLCMGAVAGEVFQAPVLEAIFPGVDVATLLGEACHLGLLRMMGPGESVFEFPSASMREAILASIPAADLRALRGQVAAGFEKGSASTRGEILEVTARFHLSSDGSDKAAHYTAAAAPRLMQQGCFAAAADFFQRALNLNLKRVLASGRFTPQAASGLYRLASQGTACMRHIDLGSAREMVTPLLEKLPALLAPEERAEALRQRALVLMAMNRFSDADKALNEALETLPAQADPELRANLIADGALILEASGDVQGALIRAIRALQTVGNRPLRSRTLMPRRLRELGRLYERTGRLDLAEESLRRARAAAGHAEAPVQETMALLAHAAVLRARQPARVREYLADAARVADASADGWLMTQVQDAARTFQVNVNAAA